MVDGGGYFLVAEVAFGADEYKGVASGGVAGFEELFFAFFAVRDVFMSVERAGNEGGEIDKGIELWEYGFLRLLHCADEDFLDSGELDVASFGMAA